MANSDSFPSAPTDTPEYLGDVPTSKYYLHHGDSPGAILVCQSLVGDNYHTWSRSMVMALTAKNKIGFVNGVIEQPQDEFSPAYNAWVRCNTMVISWLLNSLSKEITSSVIYANTTKEIWEDLRERFAQGNGPRIFEIQKSISVLSQDNSSVSSYYTRLKSLWDELSNFRPIPDCSCGAMKVLLDNKQHEYVMQFLMGLNDSFSHVRAQILMTDPLPSITKAFALVIQEERQRNINIPSLAPVADSVALFTRGEATRHNYGKNQSYKKDRPICSHCGITGHTVDKCYKLHGYPPGYKFKAKIHSAHQSSAVVEDPHLPFTQAQCQQLLSMLSSQASLASLQSSQHPVNNQVVSQESAGTSSTPHQAASAISHFMSGISSFSHTVPKHSIFSVQHVNKTRFSHSTWILDTGATDHMVHSLRKFTSITSSINTYIHLPNGEKVLATHIGTVQVTTSLLLTDVLCVPSFSFNLISISKLTNTPSCCVFFLSHFCFIQDLVTWKRIGLGRKKNGLYFLQDSTDAVLSSSFPLVAAHTAVNNTPVFDVWHHRLGHPSLSRLSLLKNVISDLVMPSANEHCKVCHISKQKRLPFHTAVHFADLPFDLIHCDIWGPYHVPTID